MDEYGDVWPDYECEDCGEPVFYGQDFCSECMGARKIAEEDEYIMKSERREAVRHKREYGPIRHLPGDFRPPKVR